VPIILAIFLFLLPAVAAAEPLASSEVRVIDGDTIAVGRTTFRLVGFDSPEQAERARCPSEAERGAQATRRMQEIIRSGALDLEVVACSCRPGTEGTQLCNYGRSCAVLRSSGKDVAGIMIAEGLARSYQCSSDRCPRRKSWCTGPL
jgi:endonuclease YncB( thermonuclease family)